MLDDMQARLGSIFRTSSVQCGYKRKSGLPLVVPQRSAALFLWRTWIYAKQRDICLGTEI